MAFDRVFSGDLAETAAISIAGFAAGAYIVYSVLPMINFDLEIFYWLVIVAGGILGAVLARNDVRLGFDHHHFQCGAALISQTLNLTFPLSAIMLVVLLLIGLIVQGNMKTKD
jgi:hypothetical protein